MGGVCFIVQEIKWGLLFVKKMWTLPPQNETKLNQTLLCFFILLVTYLGGGCVRTHALPSLPTDMVRVRAKAGARLVSRLDHMSRCLTISAKCFVYASARLYRRRRH